MAIHGEWNIDDTVGKIYSACSQNFYLSNNLFFYMTFMNPLSRNDFNVNVILLFSGINDDFPMNITFAIHNSNPNMILKESKNAVFSPSGLRTYIELPIKWKDLLNKNNGYINENNGRLTIEFHMRYSERFLNPLRITV